MASVHRWYSQSWDATIDRTINRSIVRPIVRSIVATYDRSYDGFPVNYAFLGVVQSADAQHRLTSKTNSTSEMFDLVVAQPRDITFPRSKRHIRPLRTILFAGLGLGLRVGVLGSVDPNCYPHPNTNNNPNPNPTLTLIYLSLTPNLP